MKIRFETTRDGEVAIVPRAEYERLKQLARAAATSRSSAMAAGGPRRLPKAVLDRIAGGERPIRALRQYRGYEQTELAAAAGITQGYLSDVETGKRKGPLALHQKIASALGVSLDLLASFAASQAKAGKKRAGARKRTAPKRRRRRSS